jgi:hypothetical protein
MRNSEATDAWWLSTALNICYVFVWSGHPAATKFCA